MPFCPKCRYEYREGFTTCSDCGAALVATLPEAPAEAESPSEEPLVFVYEAKDEVQATDLRGLLEKKGIPVMEKFSRFSPVIEGFPNPGVINTLTYYRLFTFASRAEEARRVIRDFLAAYERGDLSLPE
jgi:hypothetical protein